MSSTTADRPRWRRFFRFSLRTLLVVMAVLGLGLGLFSKAQMRVSRQRAAVKRVEALGGHTVYEWQLSFHRPPGAIHWTPTPPGPAVVRAMLGDDFFAHVESVQFQSPVSDADFSACTQLPDLLAILVADGRISRRGLEHLNGLDKLRELSLAKCNVSTTDLASRSLGARLVCLSYTDSSADDAMIADLAKLSRLEKFTLLDATVTDAGLAPVSSLKKLRWLDLYRCRAITDQGLVHLRGMSRLRHLAIGAGTPITDAGLRWLEPLSQLEDLNLFASPITDEGLKSIGKLTGLKGLNLHGCKVTDAGLAELDKLHHLELLDLGENSITDLGLEMIASFSKLRILHLGRCPITDAGLVHLRGLSKLERLTLGPSVTMQAASALRGSLPVKCAIQYIDANGTIHNIP